MSNKKYDPNADNRTNKFQLLLSAGYSKKEAMDYLDENGCDHPLELLQECFPNQEFNMEVKI